MCRTKGRSKSEIFKIADTATILRDGKHVMTTPLSSFTLQSMIEQLVGRRAGGFHGLERHEASLGEPGKDYVASVSADNYANGVASAHLTAKALGNKGEIGMLSHAADFFVTRQRYDGFKATIASDYPEIRIVAEQSVAGPDSAETPTGRRRC
jgi:hypothetical protein